MQVRVFAATTSLHPRGPVTELPSVLLDVAPDWTTTDVVKAAGHVAYWSFALVTPEVEADVLAGQPNTVSYTDTLLGIDAQGALYYPKGTQVPWADFLRAVHEGFFRGDPSRIVVYPYGVAGGWAPDGLWAAVQYLLEHKQTVVDAWAVVAAVRGLGSLGQQVGDRRRRAIARQWDKQGFTAPKLRRVVEGRDVWDAERLARLTSLTTGEAIAVLVNSGYAVGPDGLFRRAETPDAISRRARLDAIEEEAQRRGPRHPRDWPEDDESDRTKS